MKTATYNSFARRYGISREDFRNWVKNHQHLKFKRNNCTQCPIAKYIGSKLHQRCEVDGECLQVPSRDLSLSTPSWVARFVDKFDSTDMAPAKIANRV